VAGARVAGTAFEFEGDRVEVRIHTRLQLRPRRIDDGAGVEGGVGLRDVLLDRAVAPDAVMR
jgi:hypothetical protein